MKTSLRVLAALVLTWNSQAGEIACPNPAKLAEAYAEALKCSGRLPVIITYQGATEAETIKDVTAIKAVDGTLIVTGYGGAKQILDARRVIKITDSWSVPAP